MKGLLIMGSGSSGRQQEDTYRRQVEASAQQVKEVDPLEQQQREYYQSLNDIRMGKKPFNIHDLPGGAVAVSLFNDAKKAHDAGRIGRGFASLADGANPNYAAKL